MTATIRTAPSAPGGAVDSVNGQTGVVVLGAADVGADTAGAAAAVSAASVLDGDAAGGQLAGTYPNPSVAASHSGSTHAASQAAAEATAAAALATHTAGSVMDGDAAGGDLSGTYPNPSVVDDSHNHTAATLPASGSALEVLDDGVSLDAAVESIDFTGAGVTASVVGLGHSIQVDIPGPVTPSDTVTDETSFGVSPDPGAATDVSRGDHTHGTPADPGGGGSPFDGTTPDAPIALEPVDYLLSSTIDTIPAHTYEDGTGGVGATVTQDDATTGVLAADGVGAPSGVASTAITSAGADFAPGSEFIIIGGNNDAIGEVDTVDELGAVLTFHLTAEGTGYVVASGVATLPFFEGPHDLVLDIVSVDTASAIVAGQRIAFHDGPFASSGAVGIYTVTEPGDGVSVPWVLTRATDCDTPAKRCQFWSAGVLGGSSFPPGNGPGVVKVTEFFLPLGWIGLAIAGPGASAYGVNNTAFGSGAWVEGTDNVAAGTGSHAEGVHTIASGVISHAEGTDGVASGLYSHTEGDLGVASGQSSHAEGAGNTASGVGSHAEGAGNTASGVGSHAEGTGADAWGYAQHAHASGPGGQFSRQTFAATSTDETPTILHDASANPIIFPDFARTFAIRGRIVARRTDAPGTASVWDFAGVLDGDGSTAYRWVGGAAPVPAVIAQDAAAAAWVVELSIDGLSIPVTVTGEAAVTIDWMTTVELDEVI